MRFAPLLVALLLMPGFVAAACNATPIKCTAGQQLFYEPSSAACPDGNFTCKTGTTASPKPPVTPVPPAAPKPVAPKPAPSKSASAATSVVAGETTLSLGSRGAEVSWLQRRLIVLGFLAEGNDSGYFGSLTRTAVQAFQRARDIASSGDEVSTGYGLVGPRTKAALGGGGVITESNQALVMRLMQEVIRLTELLNVLLKARGLPTIEVPVIESLGVAGPLPDDVAVPAEVLPATEEDTTPVPDVVPGDTPFCTIGTALLDRCAIQ